jgi:hypothetical protein
LLKLKTIYPELKARSLNNKFRQTISFDFILKNYLPTDKEYLFFIPKQQILQRQTILQELGRVILYLKKQGVNEAETKSIISKRIMYIIENKINTNQALKILQELRESKSKRGCKIDNSLKAIISTINNQRFNEEEFKVFNSRLIEILNSYK